MASRIMVIHEYTVIQKIAQNYIMTEYSDAVVDVFSSTLDAIEVLKTEKYDIILCAMEMYGLDGIAFSEAILQTINKDAGFVLMTSNYDKKNIISLHQLGIKHVLSIPFTQPQLTSFINSIFNPRSMRVFERFVVNDTKVFIVIKDQKLKARLINIGLKGLLCELTFSQSLPNILIANELILKFPEAFENKVAYDVKVTLKRISVSEYEKNYQPKTIRIAYKFLEMPPESKQIIEKAIKTSANELTMAEKEALQQILNDEA
ncbi:Signal transduction response regulator, receiver region domain protein [Candidatus Magnetomorum sp. HK-1]|nr:Signal transduction response regulator, receiver region domain protein [Candidatus Magnetomorum sp. HK-1]